MARMRVRELAKELEVKNAELLQILSSQFGLHDLKPASGIDEDVAQKVRVQIIKEKDKGSEAEIVKETNGTVLKKHKTFVLKKRRIKVEEAPAKEIEGEEPVSARRVAEAKPEERLEELSAIESASEEREQHLTIVEPGTAVAEDEEAVAVSSEKGKAEEERDDVKVEAEEKHKKRRIKPQKKLHKGIVKKKALEELVEEAEGEEAEAQDTVKPQVVERVFEPGRPYKRKKYAEKEKKGPSTLPPKPSKRIIRVEDVISVGELAKRMGVKSSSLVRKFIDLGMMVTINQMIDFENAAVIADDFGYKVENVAPEYEAYLDQDEDKGEDLVPRAPVVTIMGHVDHGKTSLLDAIRKTKVAESEAGGITQSIGAYEVLVGDKKVVFIDTPGHEAFTQMRARGAKVTDLVVLVVAADDGVMPQTLEAIDHAKAAKVPLVLAINKMDKPNANPEKVKKQLAEHGLIPEEWGGEVLFANVSAKKREGIDELLELIILQADVLDLKTNPDKLARGIIIESRIDKGRGPVATAIVQEGTLKVGDPVVSGVHFGKVRALLNHIGKRLTGAVPSTPVEIIGFNFVPGAGERFAALESERLAREIALSRQTKAKETEGVKTVKLSLEELYSRIKEGGLKELPVIIKCDVRGSVDALVDSLVKIETDEVKINIIHSGVGGITESDVLLASASNAVIIGFKVRPDAKASKIAEKEKVDIKLYEVIYDLIDSVKKAMAGLLEPEFRELVQGTAEVREVFSIPKVGSIAGCYVTEGKVSRNSSVRILRDSVVVFTGKIASLKRFKDDAREVVQGYECGIGIDNFNDVKVGDVLESFVLEKVIPVL
jgi:translation initiation factor IF-2